MSKVALFDIDYTIFNAHAYRNFFQEALFDELGEGFSKEEFIKIADESYLESKNAVGYFDPEALITLLLKKIKKNANIDLLTKIVLNNKLIQLSLYDESIGVFKKLSEEKSLTLGIFSGGRIDLQRSKITAIEMFLHKEHIHIFEFKKWIALPELVKKYSGDELYIIDDVLTILYEAKKLYNATNTIWIKRGLYKDKSINGFSPDFTIQNLNEVVNILTK